MSNFCRCRFNKSRFVLNLAPVLILISAFYIYINAEARNEVEKDFTKKIDWKTPLKKCWEFPLEKNKPHRIASDKTNSSLFYISENLLMKIDPPDGREIWRIVLGGSIREELHADEESVYFLLEKENENPQKTRIVMLRSISKLTGVTKWQIEAERSAKFYFTSHPSEAYLISRNGLATIIDRSNGGKLGKLQIFTPDASTDRFTIHSFPEFKKLLFLDLDNIYLLVSDSKTFTQEFKAGSAISSVAISHNVLFWGDSSGNIWAVRTFDGKLLWKTKAGGKVSSLSVTQQGVLVSSFDNFLYFYSVEDGNLIWKKRLANRITESPLVLGDIAVAVSYGSNNADIIDLVNGQTINRISVDDNDFFVNSPLFVNGLLIFQTTRGLSSYGNSDCAK